MFKRIPILCLLVFFSCSSPVLADLGRATDTDITSTPIVQKYLSIAAEYWHISPNTLAARNHCHSYTVEIGQTGSEDLGEAPEPGCWQRLSPSEWEYIEGESVGQRELREGCLAIVHEYGHSSGHDHVNNPANVMYPEELWLGAVPGCTTAFPMTEKIPPRPTSPPSLKNHASRISSVKPDHPLTFLLGNIPRRAEFECKVTVDGKRSEEVGIWPRTIWAVSPNVAIEIIAEPKSSPVIVRAISMHGTHHIDISIRWN